MWLWLPFFHNTIQPSPADGAKAADQSGKAS